VELIKEQADTQTNRICPYGNEKTFEANIFKPKDNETFNQKDQYLHDY
jgi:hypothetical protein